MVSAASEMADASAAAGPSSSSSEASPPLKQLQQRAAAARSATPPPPSSRKLRTMPSRQTELGSKSSLSPPAETGGSRSAGETRSTWRSNRRLRRDLASTAGDGAGGGSICACAAGLILCGAEARRKGGDRSVDGAGGL